jgi:hypothetical protein
MCVCGNILEHSAYFFSLDCAGRQESADHRFRYQSFMWPGAIHLTPHISGYHITSQYYYL